MGIKEDAKLVASSLMRIASTRLELFTIELAEERGRFIASMVCLFLGLFALMMTLMLGTVWMVFAAWGSSYQNWILGILMLAYLLMTLVAFVYLKKRWVGAPMPFEATVQTFKDDVATLQYLSNEETELSKRVS